jgi:hypothetical protein
MTEFSRTKRIGANKLDVWIQEEWCSIFYNIKEQDPESLEDVEDGGKMTLKRNGRDSVP